MQTKAHPHSAEDLATRQTAPGGLLRRTCGEGAADDAVGRAPRDRRRFRHQPQVGCRARWDSRDALGLERTLLDLGAVVDLRGVERAFDQAVVLERIDMLELGRALHEGAKRPGAAKLRTVLARDAAGSTVTENGLEELMLAIIRRAGLPEPVCQHPVLGYRADFAWPEREILGDPAYVAAALAKALTS